MAADPALRGIADAALKFLQEGMKVGLGTGRAATTFIEELGRRVQEGFEVVGVPTSKVSADLATSLGIPLTTLAEVDVLDVTVDGADEADPSLNLIKGYGGALVREKIVAASSRSLVILVGKEKLVKQLGEHGKLPVEVVPFALPLCRRRLAALGCQGEPRMAGDRMYLTDNGNFILDCRVSPLADPHTLERQILDVPGVVGTGLFLDMAHAVLVQDGEEVLTLSR